jgi:hypothetical protein
MWRAMTRWSLDHRVREAGLPADVEAAARTAVVARPQEVPDRRAIGVVVEQGVDSAGRPGDRHEVAARAAQPPRLARERDAQLELALRDKLVSGGSIGRKPCDRDRKAPRSCRSRGSASASATTSDADSSRTSRAALVTLMTHSCVTTVA